MENLSLFESIQKNLKLFLWRQWFSIKKTIIKYKKSVVENSTLAIDPRLQDFIQTLWLTSSWDSPASAPSALSSTYGLFQGFWSFELRSSHLKDFTGSAISLSPKWFKCLLFGSFCCLFKCCFPRHQMP